MSEMLGTSGFGWDDEKKMLQSEKSVFDEWVKSHKKAKGLYGVPFPHFELLAEVYSKDKACGDLCESPEKAINAMNVELSSNHVIVDSDDEDDTTSSTHSTHQSSHRSVKLEDITEPPLKKMKKMKNKVKELRNVKQVGVSDELTTNFQAMSSNFGKIFQNMNENIATMANAWSKAEEREQHLHEKNNNVLGEVLNLDCVSPSEALEVANMLMSEESKLCLFYQAPIALKKQFIQDLLKKK